MAVLRIEGKEIMLPEDVVKGGEAAIRAVLAANGFPAIENADIKIVEGEGPGATTIVVVAKRSTGKGSASAKRPALYSIEEYLASERVSEARHEYIDGCIYAMAGESGEHGDICTNLVGTVHSQLRGTSCRARSKDTKVHSGPTPGHPRSTQGFFSYPDLVVICGELQYHDEHTDVILNPAVIIEVLSESTESFDRGEKFNRYQVWNSTLTDYLLVSQTAPIIEHYSRQADGSWSYKIYQGLDRSITIESIGCELRLADVYDRIRFEMQGVEEGEDGEVPR
jgi:Uma2 family endonuclease